MITLHKRGSRRRAFAGSVGIMAMVAACLIGAPSVAFATAPGPIQDMKSVKGHGASTLTQSASARSSKTQKITSTVDFGKVYKLVPKPDQDGAPRRLMGAGSSSSWLTSKWADVGASGIRVGMGERGASATQALSNYALSAGSTKAAALPISVQVTASRTASNTPSGVSLKLEAGGQGSRLVAVDIPDALLNSIYGGNYASRLRWTQTTSAGAKTSAAQQADIPSRSMVVVASMSSPTLTLTPQSSPSSATGTGNFGSTPFSGASKWDVSDQTGDFSWTYTMAAPPSAAGPTPTLGLQYDSQSTDGETGSTNNQTSPVGEGWTLADTSYITRQYVSCSEDDGTGGAHTGSGDQCWKADNALVTFGAHSGSLTKSGSSANYSNSSWQDPEDDGTKFQYLVGASCWLPSSTYSSSTTNGTHDNDCWKVTTSDGTKYWFGADHLPGWTSGKGTTNSTWTEPVFGDDSGEPCNQSTFTASFCNQAWRWNLDYVVDSHGNAEAFYYNAETNHYQQYNTSKTVIATYDRGGSLKEIDYGFTDGHAFTANAPSDKVVFGYDAKGRCINATSTASGTNTGCVAEAVSGAATKPSTGTGTYYPDVPFDQLCTSTTTCSGQVSPSFWTTAMLDTVTTSAFSSTANAYSTVDEWYLCHSFPDGGDSTASLWLTSVTRNGCSATRGTPIEPDTTFAGIQLQNRVHDASVNDGESLMQKWRLNAIRTSLGALINVDYTNQGCDPSGSDSRCMVDQRCTPSDVASIETDAGTDNKLCFAQWWTPSVVPPEAIKKDVFYKYVVYSVTADPETGGANDATQVTRYTYYSPAWRYNDSPFALAKYRTWSEFAGFQSATQVQGVDSDPSSESETQAWWYQGMDGSGPSGSTVSASVTAPDTSARTDSNWFAGQQLESRSYSSASASHTVVSETVSTPWTSDSTSAIGTPRAVDVGSTVSTEPLSGGGNRTTETDTTYSAVDGTYLPTQIQTDASDVGYTCTTKRYAAAGATVWGVPSETDSASVSCANLATAVYPADALSAQRFYYDGGALDAAPTKGDVTREEEVDGYSGSTESTANWVASAITKYDAMGRETNSTDVLGNSSSTTYTPSATDIAKGPLASTVQTNPTGWGTTTKVDARGNVVETIETDGRTTDATYDSLGRRVSVWLPDRLKSTHATSPSISYGYIESPATANSIETTTVNVNGGVVSWALFDGLGQEVQTQTASDAGGTQVTDTAFDGLGQTAYTNATYWTSSVTPSGTLFVPTSESSIPSETVFSYDGSGRVLSDTLYSYGVIQSSSSTSYSGADEVDYLPQAGGTATKTFTNSDGKTTELDQYDGDSFAAGTPVEKTRFLYDARGNESRMTDADGNTWSWTYDLLGHNVSTTTPDSGSTTSVYDDAGNLETSTDARGVRVSYLYDALDRRTAAYEGTADSNGSLLETWVWDTVQDGELSSQTTYVGSTPGHDGLAYAEKTDAYDSDGRATQTEIDIPVGAPAFSGQNFTNTTTYNVGGTIGTIAYPAEGGLSAETLHLSYNANAEVNQISSPSFTTTMAYDAGGKIAQIDRLGQYELSTNLNYRASDMSIASIGHTEYTNGSNGQNLRTNALSYDASGNVTSVASTSDTTGAETQCFRYDGLSELTVAWTPADGNCAESASSSNLGGPAPYWEEWSIDPSNGDRTQQVQHSTSGGLDLTSASTYPSAGAFGPHAVETVTNSQGDSVTTDTYSYDTAGDATNVPGATIDYNALREPDSITSGGNSDRLIYAPDGTLLMDTDSVAGTTLFLPGTELHSNQSGQVTGLRTYLANGAPFAERSSAIDGSVSLAWLGADQENTVQVEVNAATGVSTPIFNDPYGNTLGTPAARPDDHGYLNGFDALIGGLEQLGDRQYDSTIGRFLSPDVVVSSSNPQQDNPYSYSANSPVDDADPSGNCYIAATGALTHNANCAGGHGVTKAAAENTYHGYARQTTATVNNFCATNKYGCVFPTSRNLTKVNRAAVQWAEKNFGSKTGCSWMDGTLCRANPIQKALDDHVVSTSKTDFGHLVFGWLAGAESDDEYFGSGSYVVNDLRQTPNVKDGLKVIAAAVRAGDSGTPIDVGNIAGDPTVGNNKFLHDAGTAAIMPDATKSDQITFALGSYSLKAYVVDVDSQSHQATVAFSGENTMSLGSALRFGAFQGLGDTLTKDGFAQEVVDHFGWVQTIDYSKH